MTFENFSTLHVYPSDLPSSENRFCSKQDNHLWAPFRCTSSDDIFTPYGEHQFPSSVFVNERSHSRCLSSSADRPDPLRIPEVMIVIGVLLLWCGSILIFIRHSELLRIRHRDMPYRPSLKPPANLNHVTVVHRTSDTVIHSKPRLTTALVLTTPLSHRASMDQNQNARKSSSVALSWRHDPQTHSFDSNTSSTKNPDTDDHLLDPQMICTDVRRRLLDLHRKSVDNIGAIRYNISYSTNDVSKQQQKNDPHLSADERCVQESPV